MADDAERAGRKGLLKWLDPKRDYKKLVNFLLSTRLHLILCSRAKQPIEEKITEIDGRPAKSIVTLPWEPIQDRRLKYEMTIVLPMTLDGAYEIDPTRLKAPDDLVHLLRDDLRRATAALVRLGLLVRHAALLLDLFCDRVARVRDLDRPA